MLSSTEQPKRFLKKGEGLKRFAAYKPPLPTTAKKVERRQTFVRFRFDAKNASNSSSSNNNNINNNNNNINNNNHREPSTDFLPPELFDDSINLSTEVPKIAPPKIIHTPIRPNRHALGTLTYRQSDLSTPTPGNGIAALDKQIKQIESNVNELREKLKKCECIAMTQAQAQTTVTTKSTTTTARRRPTTRAAARAAAKTNNNNKESDNSTNTTPQIEERPSADADKFNPLIPIEKLILDLAENVAQLRLKYDEEMEKRND